MPATIDSPETNASRELTPEQVQETFRQLHLNDPAVRQFYEMLEQLSRQQEPPPVWLRTNIHSVVPNR